MTEAGGLTIGGLIVGIACIGWRGVIILADAFAAELRVLVGSFATDGGGAAADDHAADDDAFRFHAVADESETIGLQRRKSLPLTIAEAPRG